jgi:hypothetical protein
VPPFGWSPLFWAISIQVDPLLANGYYNGFMFVMMMAILMMMANVHMTTMMVVMSMAMRLGHDDDSGDDDGEYVDYDDDYC